MPLITLYPTIFLKSIHFTNFLYVIFVLLEDQGLPEEGLSNKKKIKIKKKKKVDLLWFLKTTQTGKCLACWMCFCSMARGKSFRTCL